MNETRLNQNYTRIYIVYFILRPHFVKNKYFPHTYNSLPPEDQQRPPGGAPHIFGTSDIEYEASY
jgi:hypothetical protein